MPLKLSSYPELSLVNHGVAFTMLKSVSLIFIISLSQADVCKAEILLSRAQKGTKLIRPCAKML